MRRIMSLTWLNFNAENVEKFILQSKLNQFHLRVYVFLDNSADVIITIFLL